MKKEDLYFSLASRMLLVSSSCALDFPTISLPFCRLPRDLLKRIVLSVSRVYLVTTREDTRMDIHYKIGSIAWQRRPKRCAPSRLHHQRPSLPAFFTIGAVLLDQCLRITPLKRIVMNWLFQMKLCCLMFVLRFIQRLQRRIFKSNNHPCSLPFIPLPYWWPISFFWRSVFYCNATYLSILLLFTLGLAGKSYLCSNLLLSVPWATRLILKSKSSKRL